MKYFLILLASLFITAAEASPQLGITPCAISAQPGDLTFSASSVNVHLSTCGSTLIVYNNSSSDARYRLGTASTTTALTTDLLLAQKTFVTLNVGSNGLWFAAIGAGGGTISFTLGTAGN